MVATDRDEVSPVVPPATMVRIARLPCCVRVAAGAEDLQDVAGLRARAYGRRVPRLAAQLQQLEPIDLLPGSTVLLARSRADGRPLGTVRLQHRAAAPLALEGSVALPAPLCALRVAEVGRLCIDRAAPPGVRMALFKAVWRLAGAAAFDWLVVVARGAMVRVYERLGYRDLLGPAHEVPMRHIADLPHRLLGLDVGRAAAELDREHRLYEFLVATCHPDIQVPAAAGWPRGADSPRAAVTA
ncbi:MAG: hypothetical protein JNL08_02380 [Planctomycetes bacterium]|nr:hypothetical protein [Planctomycetota bacterium]